MKKSNTANSIKSLSKKIELAQKLKKQLSRELINLKKNIQRRSDTVALEKIRKKLKEHKRG
ncbi:MAG: hypothetical protein WC862_02840 [Patescibacteria group bacterium]